MDEMYNKHYILIDSSNRVVGGWSDGPHYGRDTAGAVCINEQGGYQFRLFVGGEENPALFDFEDMIPLYKWDGEKVVERTAEEIEADKAAIPEVEPIPSPEARIVELEAKLKAQDELIDILLGIEEGGNA